jgi:hypothetical protein
MRHKPLRRRHFLHLIFASLWIFRRDRRFSSLTQFHGRGRAHMARPEITGKKIGRKIAARRKNDDEKLTLADLRNLDVLSVEQFCLLNGISVAMFYKMRAKDPDSVPCEFNAGRRVLISRESAEAWRAARVRAAKQERDSVQA